jgi:molecular chaperone GrpE
LNPEKNTMNAEPNRDDEEVAVKQAEQGDGEVTLEHSQIERNAEDTDGTESQEAVTEEAASGDDEPVDFQARADENWDKYLRAVAELENVRKRAARDVENAHKFAVERFATDLLAVCDSLELAMAAEGEATIESLKEGNDATRKLLGSVLRRFGVEELDPHGEPFDPNLHEAITMQPSDDLEPGSVLTVFQKGYVLNGRLLRAARVVVASESAKED